MTNRIRVWGGLTLESSIEVGVSARCNRGSHSGAKLHLLWVERIVGAETGQQSMIGRIHSVGPLCGCCQGQTAGRVVVGKAEADVTCEKCVKIAERRKAMRADVPA